MNGYIIDYNRLSFLAKKLQTNQASKQERDEYMLTLRHGNHITQQQYSDYLANRNVQEVVNAALAAGAILLLGYLLKELFTSKP